jgi:hypothetical protein
MRRLNIGGAIAIALAALVIGAVIGRPGSGQAASAAPVNSASPTIWGAAQEGQTLNASNGEWSGSPTSYSYAWSLCDANGSSCSAISGATSATYKPATTDVGHRVSITVTAKNGTGSAHATSAPSAVISSAAAPTNTAVPKISGSLQVGSALTASKGTWSGSPTSYAFVWIRCDASGNSCSRISGATTDTYTLTSADAGSTLRLSVIATNAAGSTNVTTTTAAVPASNGCPGGTGAIQIAALQPPARLMIAKASLTPSPVTRGTQTIQLHVLVTACNGRPVEGASVFAVPIPFNQFAGSEKVTGSDGTVTITQNRQRGFPARGRNQHLLAMFVRARNTSEPLLGGVSTRRTFAFKVSLP